MALGYTAREVTRLLGVPEGRVRAYVRAGLLAPERGARGEYRFSFQDLVLLRTARGLLDAEVPPRRVQRALATIRARLDEGMPLAGVHIRADGRSVVVREGSTLVRPESGQVVFDFDVGAAAREVASIDVEARRGRGEAVAREEDARQGASIGTHVEAPLDADDWYERACQLEEAQPAEARAAYLRAIALDPGHAAAHVNLGRLLHDAGDLDAAERHYRAALAAGPDDGLAAYNLGVVLEDRGQSHDAVAAYERALAADPACAEAHFNVSRLKERLGDKAAALRHLAAYRKLTRPSR